MANSSSCVAFREYYCLVPTRVLWSFLCFLGQKKTRKAHHYFSKKNRETKARHIYSPIYIYIYLADLPLYVPLFSQWISFRFPTWFFLKTCFWSSQLQWRRLLVLLQLAQMENAGLATAYSLIFFLRLLSFFSVFNLTFVLMFSYMMNVHRIKIVKLDSIASLAR